MTAVSGRAWGRRCGHRGRAGLVAWLGVALLAACGGSGSGSGSQDRAPSVPAGPTATPRTGPASTQREVAYAGTSPRQTLDLYLPAGDGRTVFPMVMLIHGGGFFSGDSDNQTSRAEFLVEKGFAVASINYRLSGDAPFPAGVQDAKAAVRFLRAKAPGWGVDPGRIAVWGNSAGGYMATMIGATGGRATDFDDPELGNPTTSSAVSAAVSWFGPSDFGTMDEQAGRAGCDQAAQQHGAEDSPESRWLGGALSSVPDRVRGSSVLTYVRTAQHLPKYLLVHGEQDCTVAPGQSQELYDALRARGVGVDLTLVPGASHEDPKIDEDQTKPTVDFLRQVFGIAQG